jgi:hypothetical protein
MPIKMLSPVGRIVQGNPLYKSPVMMDDGKTQKTGNDGQPSFNWWFNVAFDKRDPETWPMICAIKQEAAATFPQLFPQGWNPNATNEGCVRSDFAFKIKDGDGVDLNGKPHANKEGWAGCYILQISTYAAPVRCYDGLANNTPITEMEQIHTGKFVRVSLDIKGNGWTGQGNSKPGLFVNPDGCQLVGHGAKITSGPDAATMFAAPVAGYIPPGMSTTAPVASIAMPGQPAPQGQQPAMTPAPQPQMVQQPQMQMQAPAAPVYTMTALAQGHTREQWNANGQDDTWLVTNGYMTISTPAPQMAAPAPQQPVMQMQAPAPQPQMQMQQPAPMGNQPQMQAPINPAPQQPVMQMATPNPQFTQAAIAPTYIMTAAAQGYTREQWLTQPGMTDQQLIAAGMMQVA